MIEKWNARDDGTKRGAVTLPQRPVQFEGIALDHMGAGEALGQMAGHVFVIFHQGQPIRRYAARQYGLADHAGAGPDFQHRPA